MEEALKGAEDRGRAVRRRDTLHVKSSVRIIRVYMNVRTLFRKSWLRIQTPIRITRIINQYSLISTENVNYTELKPRQHVCNSFL